MLLRSALRDQRIATLSREGYIRGRIAMNVAELTPAHGELGAAELMIGNGHLRPAAHLTNDLRSKRARGQCFSIHYAFII